MSFVGEEEVVLSRRKDVQRREVKGGDFLGNSNRRHGTSFDLTISKSEDLSTFEDYRHLQVSTAPPPAYLSQTPRLSWYSRPGVLLGLVQKRKLLCRERLDLPVERDLCMRIKPDTVVLNNLYRDGWEKTTMDTYCEKIT